MDHYDDLVNGVLSATITEASVLVREVRVRIGVLSRPVTIHIYYDSRSAQPYRFEVSAYMRSARDSGPQAIARHAASEADALRRAVRMLTQDYEDAVRQGELPDDAWLVAGDGI